VVVFNAGGPKLTFFVLLLYSGCTGSLHFHRIHDKVRRRVISIIPRLANAFASTFTIPNQFTNPRNFLDFTINYLLDQVKVQPSNNTPQVRPLSSSEDDDNEDDHSPPPLLLSSSQSTKKNKNQKEMEETMQQERALAYITLGASAWSTSGARNSYH